VSGFGCQYTDDGEQKTAIVVVLVLIPYKILIHEDEHEDEYEKNQTPCALFLIPSTLYHVARHHQSFFFD
jgi:hypothetical protein